MAIGGQAERFVVVSTCGEHRAIAQSRCLGLTGADIHIYIYTYIHIYKRRTTMHHDYLPRLSAWQLCILVHIRTVCGEEMACSALVWCLYLCSLLELW